MKRFRTLSRVKLKQTIKGLAFFITASASIVLNHLFPYNRRMLRIYAFMKATVLFEHKKINVFEIVR